MKNFFICLLTLCVLCTFFSACGSDDNELSQGADYSFQTETDPTENLSQTHSEQQVEQEKQSFDAGYSITLHTYTDGHIRLKFPALSGLENTELEKECNRILKDSLLDRKQYYTTRDTLETDAEVVTSTDSFISILTTGQIVPDSSATPYFFFQTLNIDLEKGNIVRLCDKFSANQLAIDFTKQWVLSTPNGRTEEAAEYLDSLSHKELAALFSKCDVASGEIYAEGYSFVRDGQTYVYLPINHVLGDYALCKIY